MADANGQQLQEGDKVQIVQMDEPAYRWLMGERATVAHIPDDDNRETQVSILLDTPQAGIPGLSTHQAWLVKIVDESAPAQGVSAASSDDGAVEG